MPKTVGGICRGAVVAYRIIGSRPRFLLVSSSADVNRLVLPGGAIDAGETAADAAVRETREESGAIVEIERRLGRYDHLKNGGDVRPTEVFLARFIDRAAADEDRRVYWPRLENISPELFGHQHDVHRFIEMAAATIRQRAMAAA